MSSVIKPSAALRWETVFLFLKARLSESACFPIARCCPKQMTVSVPCLTDETRLSWRCSTNKVESVFMSHSKDGDFMARRGNVPNGLRLWKYFGARRLRVNF
ncbi:hypothetical protein WG66_008761 [Moniliophthora roreri]|nr:hypothetical protein WG66_008761 [Moniliophthora roreri]